MVPGKAKTYSLHVRCPYGDYDDWISSPNRLESLEQICANPCAFECPTHGAQQAFPLEGAEKLAPFAGAQNKAPLFSPPQPKKSRRSSERKPFHVPVVVYGWSKTIGSFHEQTTTLMFNASGALVRLATPVNLGDKLFIVSKFTQEELETRRLQRALSARWFAIESRFRIGPNLLAKRDEFARCKPCAYLFAAAIATAILANLLHHGHQRRRGLLDGVAYLTAPVSHRSETPLARQSKIPRGLDRSNRYVRINQIGICTADSSKLPWRDKVTAPPPAKAIKKS
jgi:hypothetical protein